MPWGVDKVKLIFFAIGVPIIQRNRLSLNGDTPFTLNVHTIKYLSLHFTVRQSATSLDKAVGKRGFAVVNVGNDGKITDMG